MITLTELFAKGAVTWNQVGNIERFTERMAMGYDEIPEYRKALTISDSFGISCQDFMVSVKAWHLLELSERFNVPYSKVMSTVGVNYMYDINSYLIGTPTYFSSVGDFSWVRKQKEAKVIETGTFAFFRLMQALKNRVVTFEPLVTVVSEYNDIYWNNFLEIADFQLETTGTIDISKVISGAFPKAAESMGTKPGTDFFRIYTGLSKEFLFSEKHGTCLFLKLRLDNNLAEFASDVKAAFTLTSQ